MGDTDYIRHGVIDRGLATLDEFHGSFRERPWEGYIVRAVPGGRVAYLTPFPPENDENYEVIAFYTPESTNDQPGGDTRHADKEVIADGEGEEGAR